MRRIKLVVALVAVLVAMLVGTAGPAMADHTNRHENRQDRHENHQDRWDNRWDRWEDRHENFFFVNPWLFVEEIDIDCDGEDDDWDGWIDEDGDCEVEIEFFEWWD